MDSIFRIVKGNLNAPTLKELGVNLDEVAEQEIERIAELGKRAVQAKVPFDKGELRDAIDIRGEKSDKQVFIREGLHTTSKTKTPLTNTALAILLQRGVSRYPGVNFRRRKNSNAEGTSFSSISEGSATEGWIEEAQNSFGV